MSINTDLDLSEWEVLVDPKPTTLPRWVVEEYCAHTPEPSAIHASVYDGRLPSWVMTDYLVESL
jgi:hypothetical protein